MKLLKDWYKNEYAFGANVFRLAFGIYFLLVGVKKLRMGYPGFAESLVTADTILAGDMPHAVPKSRYTTVHGYIAYHQSNL
tara:strand:- start:163 stop:405 length:243 start_codon:yes stop_codon:yes gene_type:complete